MNVENLILADYSVHSYSMYSGWFPKNPLKTGVKWGDPINGVGNELNNRITGNAKFNTLTGGTGNDTLDGGGGSDTYIFNRGDGQDVIVEVEQIYHLNTTTDIFWRDENGTLVTPNDNELVDRPEGGYSEQILFNQGVSFDQLWLRHVGNDLVLQTIGTTDSVTVKNWYATDLAPVDRGLIVKDSTGKTLLGSDLENLVSAMAAFSPPVAGQTSLPANYQTALSTVMAANWH